MGLSMNSKSALIIGAGEIAQEYARILKDFGIEVTLVCRDGDKASVLKKSYDIQAHGGGCELFLNDTKQIFDLAINAVTVEDLFKINVLLLQSKKIKKILTEKPGALHINEFENLSKLSSENNVPLFIAYNRRYFASTMKLKEILAIQKPSSAFFEFTEWFWKININNYSQIVLDEWLIANSSHVIDMAFFLGGGVSSLSSMSKGSSQQAKNNDQYVGHGAFNSGALFSYIADWTSAGRWKVEFSTNEGRYMLCPLEKLYFQKRGTLEYIEVSIDSSLDLKFKPGFYRQVQDFIEDNSSNLKSILEQKIDILYFNQIKK